MYVFAALRNTRSDLLAFIATTFAQLMTQTKYQLKDECVHEHVSRPGKVFTLATEKEKCRRQACSTTDKTHIKKKRR